MARRADLQSASDYLRSAARVLKSAGKPAMAVRALALLGDAEIELRKFDDPEQAI